jgi:hypothetical protein
LAEADHDYNGHRAKAAHHVHLALEDLGHHHHHAAAGGAAGSTASTGAAKAAAAGATPGAVLPNKVAHAAGTGHHEAQATSDRQLREAAAILQGVLGHVNGSKHPRAMANIQSALGEIKTALAIR